MSRRRQVIQLEDRPSPTVTPVAADTVVTSDAAVDESSASSSVDPSSSAATSGACETIPITKTTNNALSGLIGKKTETQHKAQLC